MKTKVFYYPEPKIGLVSPFLPENCCTMHFIQENIQKCALKKQSAVLQIYFGLTILFKFEGIVKFQRGKCLK